MLDHVVISQLVPYLLVSEERRIADDEVGLGPIGFGGVLGIGQVQDRVLQLEVVK